MPPPWLEGLVASTRCEGLIVLPRSLRALSFPYSVKDPLYHCGPKGSRSRGYEKMSLYFIVRYIEVASFSHTLMPWLFLMAVLLASPISPLVCSKTFNNNSIVLPFIRGCAARHWWNHPLLRNCPIVCWGSQCACLRLHGHAQWFPVVVPCLIVRRLSRPRGPRIRQASTEIVSTICHGSCRLTISPRTFVPR